MTFDKFERRCRAAGDPPFSITENAMASEASILPALAFLRTATKVRDAKHAVTAVGAQRHEAL